MNDTLRPETEAQLIEAVSWAVARGRTFDVRGDGSKRSYGRPVETTDTLDLSGFSGITDYDPSELVLTAGAATPMSEIEGRLAEAGQHLAFEPFDLAGLQGQTPGAGTLGGVVSCNLAGPRRLKAGAARDHILGFNAVSGRGEAFKSGGRVVKNVTGFDLSKLMAGSLGTLAAMTEITVKVLPVPDRVRTVLICWTADGINDHDAVSAMTETMASPHEVSGAAHLPGVIAGRSAVGYVSGGGRAMTAIRVEGPASSVAHRCNALKDMLRKYGEVEELHTVNSEILWREIADVAYFTENCGRQVWRLSALPTEGSNLALSILEGRSGEVFYDWAGGLIWLALDAANDAHANDVRSRLAAEGGHATLIRADDEVRRRVPVFQPQPATVSEITRRIKQGFDPSGVLNPGRMYDGI